MISKDESKAKRLYFKIRYNLKLLSILHVLAMWSPTNSLRVFFHKLRGTNIGKRVFIVQGAFLEEERPWLITIDDFVSISAGVIIVTHDSSFRWQTSDYLVKYSPVHIKRGSTIGARSIILPGVTVGEESIVGAGSIVCKDVKSKSVIVSPQAREMKLPEAEIDLR